MLIKIIPIITLSVFLLIATIYDFKTKQIPNFLIFLGILIGLLGQMYFKNWKQILFAFSVFLAVYLWYVLMPVKIFGEGDLKLFILVSVYTSVHQFLITIINSTIICAVFYIIVWFFKNRKKLIIFMYETVGAYLNKNMKTVTATVYTPFAGFILLGYWLSFFTQQYIF